jgi:hypothetical protein
MRIFNSLVTKATAIAVVTTILSAPALGATTFDPSTGQGFADAKDIQKALGWTNKQLDDSAAQVQFYYDASVKALFYCFNGGAEPDITNPDVIRTATSFTRHDKVNATFSAGGRGGKGFILAGMMVTRPPSEGMACTAPNNQPGMVKVKVISSSPGELTANGVRIYP